MFLFCQRRRRGTSLFSLLESINECACLCSYFWFIIVMDFWCVFEYKMWLLSLFDCKCFFPQKKKKEIVQFSAKGWLNIIFPFCLFNQLHLKNGIKHKTNVIASKETVKCSKEYKIKWNHTHRDWTWSTWAPHVFYIK